MDEILGFYSGILVQFVGHTNCSSLPFCRDALSPIIGSHNILDATLRHQHVVEPIH
jgi:hypothetical protein